MSNSTGSYGIEAGSNEEMKVDQRITVIGEASTSSSLPSTSSSLPSTSLKGVNEQTDVKGVNEQTGVVAKRPISQVASTCSHLDDDEDHQHISTKRLRLDVDKNDGTNTNTVKTSDDNEQGLGNVVETENGGIAVSTKEEDKKDVLSVESSGVAVEPSFTRGLDNETKEMIAVAGSRGRLTMSGEPGEERWRAHKIAEDYINLAGNMMLPSTYLAPFGYDPTSGQYPIERLTALGILLSPLRRPTVVEKWSPYEISVFEASLALCGKQFNQVQKFVKTKNTKEIIEFYYVWKKTSHYKVWKKEYISPEIEAQFDDSDYDD